MGHSNATAAETRAAIAAGAVSATHTFNAMRPLDHREPGILGTVLTNDALYAELICDGIHTDPEIVQPLVARQRARARHPRHRRHERRRNARRRISTRRICGAGEGRPRNGPRCPGRQRAHAGSRTGQFVAFTGATVEQGSALLTANPASHDRASAIKPERSLRESPPTLWPSMQAGNWSALVGRRQAESFRLKLL